MQSVTAQGSALAPMVIDTIVLNDFLTRVYGHDLEQICFNPEQFGEPVSVYHSSLDLWVSYTCIFDDPNVKMNFGAKAAFNSLRPQVQLIQSKLRHPILKSDLFRFRNKTYTVDDTVEDGVGVVTAYGNLHA
jgi:hypothetical protein